MGRKLRRFSREQVGVMKRELGTLPPCDPEAIEKTRGRAPHVWETSEQARECAESQADHLWRSAVNSPLAVEIGPDALLQVWSHAFVSRLATRTTTPKERK